MQCAIRTNPVEKVQDDYLWYCLSGQKWILGLRSGNASNYPDAEALSRGFSSIRVGSSFLVLSRKNAELSLAAGVPTARCEVGQHHRPITDTLYLLADSPTDENVLCGFAERCLAAEDALGLCDPTSELSAAIDEIWKTALMETFIEKFGACQTGVDGDALSPGSWIYPRTNREARKCVAGQIRTLVRSGQPFLVALTDRTPREALSELRYSGEYHVFSSRIEKPQKVSGSDFTPTPSAVIEWAGKNRKLVAGFAVVVLLAALVKSCSNTTSNRSALEGESCTNSSAKVQSPCNIN